MVSGDAGAEKRDVREPARPSHPSVHLFLLGRLRYVLPSVLPQPRTRGSRLKFLACVSSGRFPGDGGMVAPGMSCKYTIRFAPDSLGDYEDSVTVEMPMENLLVVPILAKRPPPVLTSEALALRPTQTSITLKRQSYS